MSETQKLFLTILGTAVVCIAGFAAAQYSRLVLSGPVRMPPPDAYPDMDPALFRDLEDVRERLDGMARRVEPPIAEQDVEWLIAGMRGEFEDSTWETRKWFLFYTSAVARKVDEATPDGEHPLLTQDQYERITDALREVLLYDEIRHAQQIAAKAAIELGFEREPGFQQGIFWMQAFPWSPDEDGEGN